MRISLELEQGWETAKQLREYLAKLERTLQRICEMKAESPADWYIEVKDDPYEEYSFKVFLTHL